MTTLTLAHGANVHRDRDRMRTACNDGTPWSNAGRTFYGRPGPATTTGCLPSEYRDAVRAARYVVFSYRTPIAWLTDTGWTVPDVRYSRTTSRHQSVARSL